MSAETMNSSNQGAGREPDLAKLLIEHLRLSAQDVESIRERMRIEGQSFIQAAVSLHLVTQSQIAELQELARNGGPNGGVSIIEAVREKILVGRRSQPHRREAFAQPDEQCTPGETLIIAHDTYSEHSEKVRGLRTELTLRIGASSQAAMMAIVSAGSGEGRSQLAAELAIAFAQLDRRTLLVDADFRNPGQHKLFGCANEVGLAQAIANDSPPHMYGVAGLPYMHLLTSGQLPAKPLETLSSKRLEQLVNNWRYAYDFIIFDTSPIAAFADALTVTTLLRRVLFVTRAHQTNLAAAKETLRRLSITHTEVLGAVINHF